MLETERLILRAPVSADLQHWTDFFNTERARFVGGGRNKSGIAWRVFAVFMGHWALTGTGPHIVCLKATSQIIGSAGPWFPEGWPEKELTWALWRSDIEGKGYASEAVRSLQRHAISSLGWPRAVSYIHPENVASIRLAEAVGCTLDHAAPTPDDETTLVYVHPN